MALNIKNSEVERLAAEVARLSDTSKTEAIRQALTERKEKLRAISSSATREERLRRYLELRVWPTIPRKARRRWTKEEEKKALGYGKWGEPV